jgi:hypothetical protein
MPFLAVDWEGHAVGKRIMDKLRLESAVDRLAVLVYEQNTLMGECVAAGHNASHVMVGAQDIVRWAKTEEAGGV